MTRSTTPRFVPLDDDDDDVTSLCVLLLQAWPDSMVCCCPLAPTRVLGSSCRGRVRCHRRTHGSRLPTSSFIRFNLECWLPPKHLCCPPRLWCLSSTPCTSSATSRGATTSLCVGVFGGFVCVMSNACLDAACWLVVFFFCWYVCRLCLTCLVHLRPAATPRNRRKPPRSVPWAVS